MKTRKMVDMVLKFVAPGSVERYSEIVRLDSEFVETPEDQHYLLADRVVVGWKSEENFI